MDGPRVELRCQAIKMANSPKRSIFILLDKDNGKYKAPQRCGA